MDINHEHGETCNQGVQCSVKNCTYHDGKSKCIADQIKVGPTYAVSSADTICSTFKGK